MEAAGRVFRFSTKENFRPTLIQLERNRRTKSHSGRFESHSGHGRASWSVGPTSEVRIQSEDRGDERTDPRRTIDFERPRLARSVDLPRDSRPRPEGLGTTSNDYATTTISSRAGRTRGRRSKTSRQMGFPFRPIDMED